MRPHNLLSRPKAQSKGREKCRKVSSYYPPYAVVTDTDHGAWIIIAVALGFTFVIISSLIRIFLRISFVQRPGLDDTFLAAATVGAIELDERAITIIDTKDRSSLSYKHASF
jgi:hypothetical protein